MNSRDPRYFECRMWKTGERRPGDPRTPYSRDRARLLHSAAFRRLQGKTQVMGVGEGDFHRTRLTHSLECMQIGNGLLDVLKHSYNLPNELLTWLPDRDLIESACLAHDLGHPPFGHGGEEALHEQMLNYGGFEGNGQTLRILTKLEAFREPNCGIDPTRRLVLSVLKYPVRYSEFNSNKYHDKPPKCYLDEDSDVVDWACLGFSDNDRAHLMFRDDNDRTRYKTIDCSIMEIADDIAYGVHDIEDIVARKLAEPDELIAGLQQGFWKVGPLKDFSQRPIRVEEIVKGLFGGRHQRKGG